MTTDVKLKAVPPGLTAEQAEAFPNRPQTEARIKAIDGATLLEKMEAGMSADTHAKLEQLKQDYKKVKQPDVKRALDKCNQSNAKVAKVPLLKPVQKHATGQGAHGVVDGTFPTVPTMPSGVTLSATDNATVITMALLEGLQPTEFAGGTIRTNRMPTTRPKYTDVPTEAEFKSFQPAHVGALSDLFAAGVQMYDAISDTCRPDFMTAVHGKAAPKFVVLVEMNGATLELHTPDGKPPVLATFPVEHASHIAWQVRLPACPPCNHPMHLHSPLIHPRSPRSPPAHLPLAGYEGGDAPLGPRGPRHRVCRARGAARLPAAARRQAARSHRRSAGPKVVQGRRLLRGRDEDGAAHPVPSRLRRRRRRQALAPVVQGLQISRWYVTPCLYRP